MQPTNRKISITALGRFSDPANAYNEIVFIDNELDTTQIDETLNKSTQLTGCNICNTIATIS